MAVVRCKHLKPLAECLPCRWGATVFADHKPLRSLLVDDDSHTPGRGLPMNPTPGLTTKEDRCGYAVLKRLLALRSRIVARGTPEKSRRILLKACEAVEYEGLRLAYVIRFCGLRSGRKTQDEVAMELIEDICENDPKERYTWRVI